MFYLIQIVYISFLPNMFITAFLEVYLCGFKSNQEQ